MHRLALRGQARLKALHLAALREALRAQRVMFRGLGTITARNSLGALTQHLEAWRALLRGQRLLVRRFRALAARRDSCILAQVCALVSVGHVCVWPRACVRVLTPDARRHAFGRLWYACEWGVMSFHQVMRYLLHANGVMRIE